MPNLVTASRGLAGPIVAWCLISGHHRAGFWLFTAAAFTDLFDGWLAARLGSDRELGAWLDPLADKVLGGTTWLTLWWLGWAPGWLVWPLLVRDLVVGVLWHVLSARGVTWRAAPLGQVATSYEGAALGILVFHGPWLGVHWPSVGVWVGLSGLALSFVSAIGYAVTRPPPVDAA